MTAAGRSDGGPHGERDERVVLPETERIARRGSGPVLVAILVAAAFLVGVVQPWDWLAPPAPGGDGATAPAGLTTPGERGTPDATAGDGVGTAGGNGLTPGRTPEATQPPAPAVEPTCAYPTSWRVASVQDWAGRVARVWSATRAVEASGPQDPSIPFAVITSSEVVAFGWCAPVTGPERPPLAAEATLYRIVSGAARELAFDRLEPNAPNALGELWAPPPQSVGRRPPWAQGRYVIRLATPDGAYARYLGIEVIRVVREASPSPSG